MRVKRGDVVSHLSPVHVEHVLTRQRYTRLFVAESHELDVDDAASSGWLVDNRHLGFGHTVAVVVCIKLVVRDDDVSGLGVGRRNYVLYCAWHFLHDPESGFMYLV